MNLFANLKPNALILTPNRRLAATLLREYNQGQLARGLKCWPTLTILPFASWIKNLWDDYTSGNLQATPNLLNPHQEQLLWEEILKNSPEGEYLLQIAGTAELAKSAWSLLKQWRISSHTPELQATENSQAFAGWAKKFEKICHDKNVVDAYKLVDVVTEKMVAQIIRAPSQIILFGFTELSPQQNAIFAACTQQQCVITTYEPTSVNKTIHTLALSDNDTELRTMARWAQALHKLNPSQKIACVISNLENIREKVTQIFSSVGDMPFNISAGISLAHFPIIHTALQLLNLDKKEISLEVISNLLRSPFLGDAEREVFNRALLNNKLHCDGKLFISLEKLLTQPFAKQHCAGFVARLQHYYDISPHQKLALSCTQWAEIFSKQLQILGWPGERPLNSTEYQVVQRWLELLSEFATLDNVLGPQKLAAALTTLTELATKTIFQPQSPEAPIQILGMLEAAALPFEHMWLMGLDDTQWPPTPKPNPFIPLQLQRQQQMPHATAERELIYCQHLMRQLIASSTHVIASYPLHLDDQELQISPLLADLPKIILDELPLVSFTSAAQIIQQSKSLEEIQDETAPVITDTQSLRGGTSIFKLQAACPFRAFAEVRLQARANDTPTTGLNSKERGNIIHLALQSIWESLCDHATLYAQTDEQLTTLVQYCVTQAINSMAEIQTNQPRYLAIEAQRAEKLLLQWLKQEKYRPSFKVVGIEELRETMLSNIPLKLRIDRIDELEDGNRIIIDYKTSKILATKKWFGERPDEPQLPLYCITENAPISGIAFAQVSAGGTKFIGISDSSLAIRGISPVTKQKPPNNANWDAQIQVWHTVLEKLGTEFRMGDARVMPKNNKKTCATCHLHALCRIHED